MLIAINTLSYCQTVGPWDLDRLYQVPDWEVTTLAPKDGVTSLLFSSIDYLGNPVQVFAYYGVPDGEMPEGGWPALVHAHGGGGTAYSQWVSAFNEQGHAAISLDLEGHIPTEDNNGAYLPSPNPGPSRSGVFNGFENPVEEQWYYHAIAQVILGHTLIASFPEINADKIGVSGASWGGTITSTVMGVDNRWAWAVPVYGAGYLDDTDGAQGVRIEGAKATFVNQYYDGSAYFDRVNFPTLFINGTNDYNFAMPCNQRSAEHVNGHLRFSKGFGHSNLAPLRLDELISFANQVTYGDDALPAFELPSFDTNQVATVRVTSEAGLSSAELLYTINDGYWYEREWLSIPATITGNTLTATLPEGTTTFYFTATDSRELMTSSKYVETENGTPPLGNPNIAIYGAASQSSTDYFGDASRAIDEDTSGVYADGSVSHTTSEDNAWWQVELVGSHHIDEIVIHNRTDAAYMARLTNFTVYVIDTNGGITFSQSFNSFPDPSVSIDAAGAFGNIIKVQLDATDTPLSLAEVQVYEVENVAISVTQVSVSPQNASLQVGSHLLLTSTVSPADATDQSVNWRSSNISVATVDEVSGLVTAHGIGSAIITATTTDGEFTDNCLVSVTSTLGDDNLTINGTASQSSTAYEGEASRAIDQNTNGVYSGNSVSHTGKTIDEWWMVSLDDSYYINEIIVHNRTDPDYMNRLNHFTVQVLDDDDFITFTQTITSTPDPFVIIPTDSAVGNRVRILQNKAATALALAEVEVYGDTLSTDIVTATHSTHTLLNTYPNPANNQINLAGIKGSGYELFDNSGVQYLTGKMESDNQIIRLDHISNGMYFIRVIHEQKTQLIKLIVKHE